MCEGRMLQHTHRELMLGDQVIEVINLFLQRYVIIPGQREELKCYNKY